MIILLMSPVILVLIIEKPDITINFTKNSSESAKNVIFNEDDVINFAANMIEEDFCEESMKAALLVAETNFKSGKNDEINADGLNEELREKLRKLYKSLDAQLTYKEKYVYIPTTLLSAGNTKKSKSYPYIISVASPWDTFDKDYVFSKEYPEGISMKGIDYLCKNGMSYKNALKWYLPDFCIK